MLILDPSRKVFANMYFREKQSWFSLKISYFLKNSFLFKMAFIFTAYPYHINPGAAGMGWGHIFQTFCCVVFLHVVFLQLVICSSGSVPRELNQGLSSLTSHAGTACSLLAQNACLGVWGFRLDRTALLISP